MTEITGEIDPMSSPKICPKMALTHTATTVQINRFTRRLRYTLTKTKCVNTLSGFFPTASSSDNVLDKVHSVPLTYPRAQRTKKAWHYYR
jgi:hypothetical protein